MSQKCHKNVTKMSQIVTFCDTIIFKINNLKINIYLYNYNTKCIITSALNVEKFLKIIGI